MGSAFTPVHNNRRTVSPMPNNSMHVVRQRRSSKRTRQASSLHQMNILTEQNSSSIPMRKISEEDERTADTAPDHISTSDASEADTNNSQPPLLDFVGATCSASAWFTSCFPCAVVDINDSDDYVVDKISRENAMNVMYNNNLQASPGNNSLAVTPESSPMKPGEISGGKENDVMYISVSPNDGSIHNIPSVIEEDGSDEDADMVSLDEVSLEENDLPQKGLGIDMPILEEPTDVVMDNTGSEPQISSPPKKKRLSMRKLFGKKSKA